MNSATSRNNSCYVAHLVPAFENYPNVRPVSTEQQSNGSSNLIANTSNKSITFYQPAHLIDAGCPFSREIHLKCARFDPQTSQTSGLFIAVIQKLLK